MPIIGIVENMSYFVCPNCNEKHYIFGKSKVEEEANKYGIKHTATLPINPSLAQKCDEGSFETFEGDFLNSLGSILEGK